MTASRYNLAISTAALLLLNNAAMAKDDAPSLHGELQFQQRSFAKSPTPSYSDGVKHSQSSVMLEAEWLWQNDNSIINIKPFARVDSHDSERSHFDLRELQWLHYWQDYEVRAGIGRVFWGVTESQHLVDVVNQTDGVEGLDAEDKLGQPMLSFKASKVFGTFETYLLPYFRERTFAGAKGRFAPPLAVAKHAEYEAKQEEQHLDWALRYSHSIADWDVALSYFQGTNREPILHPRDGQLVAYYAQMQQSGLELQRVAGDWLWKLEARYRDSDSHHYATTAGFEYTQVGVWQSTYDLGWIAELSYDSRNDVQNQNDLFVGWRLAFNDADSSEILLGVSHDLEHAEYALKLEAAGRLNERWKWQVEGYAFSSNHSETLIYSLRNDDFVEFALSYYF